MYIAKIRNRMKKKKVYYVPSSVLLLLLIDLCYVLKFFEIKIVFMRLLFSKLTTIAAVLSENTYNSLGHHR
jgi:hypothetical protein